MNDRPIHNLRLRVERTRKARKEVSAGLRLGWSIRCGEYVFSVECREEQRLRQVESRCYTEAGVPGYAARIEDLTGDWKLITWRWIER